MPVKSTHGSSPLIIALPYTGSSIPAMIYNRLNDRGRALSDTDYYLDRLVTGCPQAFSTVRANFHRYVSDVDYADPASGTMPNKQMVGIVPLRNWSGQEIWDIPPNVSEAASWRSLYFAPFHAALSAQIARVRAQHGFAILIALSTWRDRDKNDPAAIRLATHMAQSETVDLALQSIKALEKGKQLRAELNGLMDCGYITQHYGKLGPTVHTIELNICQDCYLSASPEPGHFDEETAQIIQDRLAAMIAVLAGLKRT